MTSVTIFGTGAMGTAIADVLTAGGATVDHVRSSDPPGPVNGDIVVLAVPHPASEAFSKSTLASWPARSCRHHQSCGLRDLRLAGRAHTAPMAAELADELPSSRCSRRSTRTLRPLSAKNVGPNDPRSRRRRRCATRRRPSFRHGVKARGSGRHRRRRTSRARELEAMGFLQIKLAAGEEVDSTGGFGVVRQADSA